MTVSSLFGRLWRYATLGVAINGLCYVVFLLFVRVGTDPLTANALCYGLGLALGYFGNRRWTFRSGNRHLPDMLRFGAAHIAGFASSITCIAFTMRILPIALAQLVAVAVAAGIIFVILQITQFGQTSASECV